MNSMQLAVMEFHRRFGVPVASTPGIRNAQLRQMLIAEEANETLAAIDDGNLVEAIDGLCDLIYVCLGAACEFGVDLAPFFAEVHRTNMLKEGGMTRADGKIMKPEGWTPPDIAGILAIGEGSIP